MESGDKEWASKYLLDPLNAPEPSQEDGPGNTFRPGGTVAPVQAAPPDRNPSRRLSKTNPYRKSSLSSNTNISTSEIRRSVSLHNSPKGSAGGAYPSPPPSATSPRNNAGKFSPLGSPRSPSHRQEAFGGEGGQQQGHRRRGSSLSERYPGDKSHRPLDTLTKEKHVADRARHATKKHHIMPDTIDNLDHSGGTAWHHGGPYDATLFARNNTSNSPLAAVATSNAEALKATPRERIVDSVQRHRPLDGVAAYAPGNMDRLGNVYNYEEGDNMMIEGGPEGGAYKRWPGVQYHPDDIKGKGEPSYSIEKAFKDHNINEEKPENNGIELTSRHRSSSGAIPLEPWHEDGDGQQHLGRSGSFSKRLSGGLKKRFGSIKKKPSSP